METLVPTVKAPEQLSPEREALEIKFKEVEIDQKLQDLASGKLMDELEVERRKLENDQVKMGVGGWNSSLDQLLAVAKCWTINNERTLMSDPVLKSIWDDDEMEEIKSLIMKKARKL